MTIKLSEEDVKKRKRRFNDPEKSYKAYKTERYELTAKEKGCKRKRVEE